MSEALSELSFIKKVALEALSDLDGVAEALSEGRSVNKARLMSVAGALHYVAERLKCLASRI